MNIIPDFLFERVWDIDEGFLRERDIRALILDIDNTLTFDGDGDVPPRTKYWLDRVRAAGIKAAIVSNNSEKRVAPFAEACRLPYIADALKPSEAGFARSRELLGESAEHIAVVGDQLFTDIAFGSRFGCVTIMVERMGPDIPPFVKFKRLLEKPFMGRIRRTRRIG